MQSFGDGAAVNLGALWEMCKGVLLTIPLRRLLLARSHYSLAAYAFSSHVVYQPFMLRHRNALTKKTWEETVQGRQVILKLRPAL